MWQYIGIFLVILGVWQAFMNGSYSRVVSTVLMFMGVVVAFVSSWKIGLALVFIFLVFIVGGQLIGHDKKKIEGIIKAFADAKKKMPDSTEDAICRSLIVHRLFNTKNTNPIGIKTIEDAEKYVSSMPATEFTLENTCHWIVGREKMGTSSTSFPKPSDRLDKYIEMYKKKYVT